MTSPLTFHEKSRIEGLPAKLAWLKAYARDKRKIVVVARYLSQITYLAKELAKEREVHIVTGATKDQEGEIKAARESFENYLLVQADLGAGWEAPEFQFVIFASLSFSVRSLTQMRGRFLRVNKLQSVWTTYLLGGKLDESVYIRTVKEGLDFT